MIFENDFILMAEKMLRHLQRILKNEYYDQTVSRTKFEMDKKDIKESKLYNPKFDNQSLYEKRTGKLKTDRANYEPDFNRFLNNKITPHNSAYLNQKMTDRIKQKLNIGLDGIRANTLWMTSEAYEFFFITLPQSEINQDSNIKLTNTFKNLDDIHDNFLNLRKALLLLYAPVSLGLACFDNDFYPTYRQKSQNLTEESCADLMDIYKSEGFVPSNIIYDSDVNQGSVQQCFEDQYDFNHNLNTFFVILFADDLEELMQSNKYTKDKKILNAEGLVRFYIDTFMPFVINKIYGWLNANTVESVGWRIYQNLSDLKNSRDLELKQYYSGKLVKNLTELMFDWEGWFKKEEAGAQNYSRWKADLNNKDVYNPFSRYKDVDDLLNNTFSD